MKAVQLAYPFVQRFPPTVIDLNYSFASPADAPSLPQNEVVAADLLQKKVEYDEMIYNLGRVI